MSTPHRPALERFLDLPERALLWLPWPSTPRIILKGSLGFMRQVLRSRALSRPFDRGHPSA